MARYQLPDTDVLRQILDYDAETGVLTWREVLGRPGWMVGTVAGSTNSQGYRYIRFRGRHYQAHRIIWKWCHGEEPGETIDHLDGDRKNNRIANLRSVPLAINARNIGSCQPNKWGVRGVKKRGRRFEVYGAGKQYLGSYTDLNEAAKVRLAHERASGYSERHSLQSTMPRHEGRGT